MSWDAIDCIERNGVITGYEVEFQRVGGAAITDGEVVGQTFTASGLQPFTNYTYQVAGVNSEGRGPFSDLITIRTNEDGKFESHSFICLSQSTILQFLVLCLISWLRLCSLQ